MGYSVDGERVNIVICYEIINLMRQKITHMYLVKIYIALCKTIIF